MKKRTVLSIIIGLLCFMNFFIPCFEDITYFDLFIESLGEKELNGFFKFVFMSPTAIIIILTLLHIYEPKSDLITRNYLAIASISGFIYYLIIYLILYLGASLFGDIGEMISGRQSKDPELLDFGITPVLYPLLFLAYVLVHRYMSYSEPEMQPIADVQVQNTSPNHSDDIDGDRDEFV